VDRQRGLRRPAETVAPFRRNGPTIEQRFLIKFCYAQYKHQIDVLRCLERRAT
jgi:hypothetical protein